MEQKKRVKKLIESRGGNQAEFARQCGMTPNELHGILNEAKKAVNHRLLLGIAQLGYSTNWVLTGEGDMEFINITKKDLEYLKTQIQVLENLIKK
tara:strand:+ start:2655 stop:2939 length:285 start_codon:yes stop_codon:yes gene_type:complete